MTFFRAGNVRAGKVSIGEIRKCASEISKYANAPTTERLVARGMKHYRHDRCGLSAAGTGVETRRKSYAERISKDL